ncbi:RrF2 family transcriptional regulator [Chloroflexota bacterium]
MKLSTKGRYGTRLLLDIALHEGEEPVALKDVARRQSIPLAYLKQLVALLVGRGVLRSTRGVGGGVALAKYPREIKLKEVIDLLEGSTPLVECISNPQACERSGFCVTRDVWNELETATNKILEATTIEDLVERQKKKQPANGDMYNI